eukprot:1136707-Pelagomonas_calceolata.AAC.10
MHGSTVVRSQGHPMQDLSVHRCRSCTAIEEPGSKALPASPLLICALCMHSSAPLRSQVNGQEQTPSRHEWSAH